MYKEYAIIYNQPNRQKNKDKLFAEGDNNE